MLHGISTLSWRKINQVITVCKKMNYLILTITKLYCHISDIKIKFLSLRTYQIIHCIQTKRIKQITLLMHDNDHEVFSKFNVNAKFLGSLLKFERILKLRLIILKSFQVTLTLLAQKPFFEYPG
jgi:hypothetical protein